MYKACVYICCGLIYLVNFASGKYPYKEYFFKQRVDHFSYANNDQFMQRYLMNANYWNAEDGCIFLYTGNEGDIEMFTNNAGFMWENAEKFNALLLFIEHRFYGQSLPYGSDSLTNATFRGYLTSEQALADYAVITYHMKQVIPGAKNAPVVAFGGSYGGMLAAWMRIKYPHLIKGAIASSAPILHFKGLVHCSRFSEIVTLDFMKASPQCVACIKRSWAILREIGSTESGAVWLSRLFNLCLTITPIQINDLIGWMTTTWVFLATTDYPYPTNFLVPLPGNPVNVACEHLKDASVPDVQLLVDIFNAVSVFQNYTGQVPCHNLSEPAGKSLGDEAWDYQACTEMVMPMCQNPKSDMFENSPWDFSQYAARCIYRWNIAPELDKALMMYGGRDITDSSNIIFSNGDLDPWLSGGVLESLSDTLIAIRIRGGAHHMDIRASHPGDPVSVLNAREIELDWIKKWTTRKRA